MQICAMKHIHMGGFAMKKFQLLAAAAVSATIGLSVTESRADDLTLCWAAWDPANA